MILFALATLGATVVAFVLYPVFADSGESEVGTTDAVEREIIALEEKKTRLYDAITDLDFEKDAGKVSDQDHQAARNDYLTQVAEIMTRLDTLAPKRKAKADEAAEKPAKRSKEIADSKPCPSCGKSNRADSKFCMHCGAPTGQVCSECGEALPKQARFCMACGHEVSA